MSDIAIKVENLGKSYRIGHNAPQAERYTALRDIISRNAHNLVRKTRDMFHGKAIVQGDEVEEFWALKDVNFEIKQGDCVGIIGRNGAGKSTLLKILSRITEPTTGRVTINGRAASLLEVGTGFHPELTGRENIFLNGAILGMGRKEIQRKFDEIVDFAEVERFLDTPVKRYSSGMYVRLAFAVAAHLEPDILVIDEVLAVGDSQFQKKCLGKMEDVASNGRTVLFVSHNLTAINALCNKGILISHGKLAKKGNIDEILSEYASDNIFTSESTNLREHKNRKKESRKVFNKILVRSNSGKYLKTGDRLIIEFYFDCQPDLKLNEISISVESLTGLRIFSCATYWSQVKPVRFNLGLAICEIDNLPLAPGDYTINIAIGNATNCFIDHIPRAHCFTVHSSDFYKTGRIPTSQHGLILLKDRWK